MSTRTSRAARDAAVANRRQHLYGLHAVRAVLERRSETVLAAKVLRDASGKLAELERALAARGIALDRVARDFRASTLQARQREMLGRGVEAVAVGVESAVESGAPIQHIRRNERRRVIPTRTQQLRQRRRS